MSLIRSGLSLAGIPDRGALPVLAFTVLRARDAAASAVSQAQDMIHGGFL